MFDRKGKCPICRKDFRSLDCKHSYDYVTKVLEAAEHGDEFGRDVNTIKKRNRYICS